MGRRSGRAAARRAAAALESTPKRFDAMEDEDEPMIDAAPEPSSPAPSEPVEEPEEEAEAEEEEEEAPPAEDEDEDGEREESGVEERPATDPESAKSPSPPPQPTIRRKRLGRPPKNRPPDWDGMIEVPVSRDSDSTPRRRGRGGWRGRGGRKGEPARPTQQQIDKEGNMLDIVNDEVALPEDPEGETKVDKNGNLLGGREYRCRTFTVQGKGDRLYMLSTEPARCVGFRDSYLFFTKHLRLTKVIVDDEEKRDMIEREIIPHSYKGRAIGIVTARSVFREFGALIIVGGRRIIDDYEVAKLRAEGVVEGEIADPLDRYVVGEPYNKNQYVAWHGASAVYHSVAPAVPQQAASFAVAKKRRVPVNDTNWMLEHAREASNFNSMLSTLRKANLNGIYDVHTNVMQYPATMQPTHARIEQVPLEAEDAPAASSSNGHHASKDDEQQTQSQQKTPAGSSSIFTPLPPAIPRNFRVVDIVLETPPAGIAPASYDRRLSPLPGGTGVARHDASDFIAPFRGLGAVSNEIRDLLPPECRAAFDAAAGRERDWHARWGSEAESTCRRDPTIDKSIVPFSKAA